MKAVRIHSTGDPSVLQLEEVPRPSPGPGEVLIRVHAAGVNPVDFKIRSGSFKREKIQLPTTLGRDVSGVIEEVGSGESAVRKGDEVYAYLAAHSGGYAEYALAKVSEIALKPKSLDHRRAAAVPLAATTAWQGLFDEGGLKAGERVLVHGAAGGVGHFAVQLAKARGATVVATARGEDVDMVRNLGANQVIDYTRQRFEDEAGEVDLVLDLVAGDTQDRSWNVLKRGGRLVSTLGPPSQEKAAAHHAEGKSFMAKARGEELAEIARLIDTGAVQVAVTEVIPLEDAELAHQKLEQEHTRGKYVLSVS